MRAGNRTRRCTTRGCCWPCAKNCAWKWITYATARAFTASSGICRMRMRNRRACSTTWEQMRLVIVDDPLDLFATIDELELQAEGLRVELERSGELPRGFQRNYFTADELRKDWSSASRPFWAMAICTARAPAPTRRWRVVLHLAHALAARPRRSRPRLSKGTMPAIPVCCSHGRRRGCASCCRSFTWRHKYTSSWQCRRRRVRSPWCRASWAKDLSCAGCRRHCTYIPTPNCLGGASPRHARARSITARWRPSSSSPT